MKRFLLFIYFCSLYFYSHAQIGGRSTYEFLNLTNSSKSAALGGKLISQYSNDLSLIYYNPSLLNSQMNDHLTLNYVNYFLDINYGYVAYAPPGNSKLKNVAAGIHFINYGKFIEADYTGQITGNFRASEYAINIAWAKNIDSLFSFGVNIKPVFSALEKYISLGIATDIGITYHNNISLFTAALVVRNLGYQLKAYNEIREPLPFEIQLGITKKLLHAPFRLNFLFHHLETFDLTYELPEEFQSVNIFSQEEEKQNKLEGLGDKILRHINIGIELLPFKNFYFALGYNFQRAKELNTKSSLSTVGLSWGFGLSLSKFQVAYARSNYHMAGSTNHFSFTTNLSELLYKKGNL
ncbi:MAG: type IX secretion system protein PorQ [Bacteroidales bacterium]|nr:type IX secretion system protein PorQ [Bacteroidales bacterium]